MTEPDRTEHVEPLLRVAQRINQLQWAYDLDWYPVREYGRIVIVLGKLAKQINKHAVPPEATHDRLPEIRDAAVELAARTAVYAQFMSGACAADVMVQVEAELWAQDDRWGSGRIHPFTEWLSILTEEVGELGEEIEADRMGGADAIREAIQCAACAVRMLEAAGG